MWLVLLFNFINQYISAKRIVGLGCLDSFLINQKNHLRYTIFLDFAL